MTGKWGRTGYQSLLAHSLNALSVSLAIMKLINWQQDSDKWNVVITSRLIHDYAKKRWQKGKPPKALTDDEIKRIKEMLLEMGFSKKIIEKSLDLALKDETPGNVDDALAMIKRAAPTPDEQDVAILGDRLASIKDFSNIEHQIYGDTKHLLNRFGLSLTYHRVGIVRGITTLLLHKALIQIHQEHEFIPVLYFPSGVLYIGKDTAPKVNKERLLKTLKEELKGFIELQASSSIGQAAMGAVNQTPLKAPEYALMSLDAIQKFWHYALGQNVIKSPAVHSVELKGKEGIGRELSKIINIWNTIEEGEREALIKLYKGIHHLFVYFNALLKAVIEWGAKDAEETVSKVFLNIFGKLAPQGLFSLKFTTKKAEAVAILTKLLNSLDVKNNLENALSLLEPFIMEASNQITQKCSQEALKKISEPLCMLLNDLVYPSLENPKDVAQKSYNKYNSGKRKAGTPVCVIDGNPAEITGIAQLHGQGVQSFNNLLAGGSQITTTNKSMFCRLCNMEAQLRALIMSRWANGEILFLVPQVNSTSTVFDEIWQKMCTALEGIANIGKISDCTWWAEQILENKLNVSASTLFVSFLAERPKANKYEAFIDELVKILKEESKGDLTLLMFNYPRIKASNFREFAKKALEQGVISKEKIREASLKASAAITIVTANYGVMLIPSRIRSKHGDAEESETSALIRKMFFGTLMARLFLASTIYADTPLSVLPAEIYPQGYFRIPKKLGLRPVLENLNLLNDSWIPLEKVDEILEKLAALLKVEEFLGQNAGYGKDSLLEIATRHRGMVLARAAQAGKAWPQLVRLLDRYWDV